MSVRKGSLVAVLVASGASGAFAQIPIGPERVVQQNPTGVPSLRGGSRATALLPDGGFVVAWTRYLPAGYDIVGRRFDSRGLPRGPEFLVN